MGLGKDIASKLPPPSELDDVMPDEEGGEAMPSAEGEDAAAENSAMEEFSAALKGGSIEDKVAAFKSLMEICSPKGY